MDSVQCEKLGIVDPSLGAICKLKRVHQCSCDIGDVPFHNPLKGLHNEGGGRKYGSEVIQDLKAALLGDGDDCRVFVCGRALE